MECGTKTNDFPPRTVEGEGEHKMGKDPQYFIVEARALPEVFLKVAEAKRLLETREVHTVNQAAEQVGISRSAFYKYKDAVRPFNDMLSGRIINVQILLKNEPGVLSAVLNDFARCGANILTINQSIPAGGGAVVSVGAETSGLTMTTEELLEQVSGEIGVVRCEILGG